ncbi:MAG: hypothetical protein V4735_05885 [Pseudomonadota bacterium]
MTAIAGIVSAALTQSPLISTPSPTALDDILKKYTPENFTQTDFLALDEDLQKAGISATEEVVAAIEAKGFNLEPFAQTDPFGPAVTLDLSPPGQTAAGGGGAPVGGAVTYDSVSEAVTKAKREVSPQVGVSGADQVVDTQGNIDYGKLQQLVDLQAAKTHRDAA